MGNREWTPVEIFKFVDTGDDLGTPDSFVDYAAYTELRAEAEKLAAALEPAQEWAADDEPMKTLLENARKALTNWQKYLEGEK